MDLVHDHGLDGGEDLAGSRGQHQVEALWGRDQDVWRVAQHAAAILGRGVSGAERHGQLGVPDLGESGGSCDSPQRGPQVALDVVGECLEGRHIQDPAALSLWGHLGLEEAIDRPQEGGQRLAGAGGGVDQSVVAGCDGLPAHSLSRSGRLEGGTKPGGGRWRESVESAHERRMYRGGVTYNLGRWNGE